MTALPYHILFVGSIPPPITGQSFSFEQTYKGIACKKKILVGHSLANKNIIVKIWDTIVTIGKIVLYVFFLKIHLIYFTSSRTFLGGFKDLVLINLAALFRIKTVNHVHGTALEKFFADLPSIARRMYKAAYRRIDLNIVLLPQMAQELTTITSTDRIVALHNFYDPELDRLETRKKENHVIQMLYLSNIIKSKGIFELLEAFKSLSMKNPQLTLTIAGDFFGDEYISKGEIKKMFFEQLNGIGSVKYVGPLSGAKKSDVLFNSDIFILPTYYKIEAYPISILEAMRAGNYIIATNHNYLPHIVKPENGVTIEKKSAGAIVNAVEHIVANPNKLRTIQANNMQIAKDNYSFSAYISRITAIFDKVIANK